MHKVLVVDDDKVLQQSVKQALQYHHFDVEVAVASGFTLFKLRLNYRHIRRSDSPTKLQSLLLCFTQHLRGCLVCLLPTRS